MNDQRIQEVFSDEAFVQKLFSLETPEEAQAALKEKGVEVSVEELSHLRDFIVANVNEHGELSLDALDNVAGGFLSRILPAIKPRLPMPSLPTSRLPLPLPRTW